MLDWSLALIMGNIPPPRDPNDDDDDEDHCGCVSPKNCAKPRLWQLEQRVPAPRRNQQSSEAFSDSADVQRRFTSLPLEFGLANPGVRPGVHTADDRSLRKNTRSKWRKDFSKQE
jgi:hypothetical protein